MKSAILGAGFIAEFHAVGYQALEDVQLCAICDKDAQRAQAMAKRFGCAWYTEAEKMFVEQKPDLASICLPTFLHKQYVCMALENGAHVLCEKPLALSMEEGEAMHKEAQRNHRMLMTGQVLRWWPEYMVIANEIRQLGMPLSIQARRYQHPSREGWHMQENLGGGALFDLFVHDMDFVMSLLGTDTEVIGAVGHRGGGGSWRQVTTMLRWKNGTYANLEASNQMPTGYPFTAAFHAQYASAALDYRFRTANNIQLGTKTETEFSLYKNGIVSVLPFAENAQEKAFKAQIAAFVEGVRTGVNPLPLEETLRVMKVIHRVKQCLEMSI